MAGSMVNILCIMSWLIFFQNKEKEKSYQDKSSKIIKKVLWQNIYTREEEEKFAHIFYGLPYENEFGQ